MPLSAEAIDAMVASGLSAEQMARIIKAEVAADEAKKLAKEEERKAKAREGNRERQARFRDRRNANNASNGVTGCDVALPPAPSPLPPQTPPITPNPSPVSDPSGSGSPSAEPSVPATLVEIEPRRDLFGRGVQAVARMTGRAVPGCKALVGKWLGLAQDSAVIVLTVIDQAVEADLANPIPWIEKTIRNEVQRNGSGPNDLFSGRPSGGRSQGTVHSAVSAAVARHADRRSLRSGGGEDCGRSEDREDHRPRRHDPEIEDADWTPASRHYAAH